MTPSRFLAVVLSSLILLTAPVSATEVQDINQQFRKGDLAGALQRANAYLSKNPKDAQARFLKGLILADQGKANEAIQVFTALTEDFPELPEPYNNLAVLYAAQNKYDAAKNALEMAIRTHPSYATAHENLGDIYAKMASIAYDKALQLDNTNPSAQTKLALIKDIVGGQPHRTAPTKPAVIATAPPKPSVTAVAQIPSAETKPAKINKPAASEKPAADPSSAEGSVASWARAWASRDVDAYLAFYASDFNTPDGMARGDWEALRRERITKPTRIAVSISNIKTDQSDPDKATVNFKQVYQSDRLKSISSKTLELALHDGKWQIVRESTR
ncbi:MAG: tetratricopeptide repeat protein [Thiobacillaceae bacterium]